MAIKKIIFYVCFVLGTERRERRKEEEERESVTDRQ
jgi:hypothetical protein